MYKIESIYFFVFNTLIYNMSIMDKITSFFGGGAKNEEEQTTEAGNGDMGVGMPETGGEEEAPVITPEPEIPPAEEVPAMPSEPANEPEIPVEPAMPMNEPAGEEEKKEEVPGMEGM